MGGSCDVFCGVEKSTGKRHAIKVLREPNRTHRQELQQEAEVLAKLDSDKVVGLICKDTELDSGNPVLVMDYCHGGSLQSFLMDPRNGRGLDDPEFLALLRDITEALQYLNSVGIVHRDIKPGNILRDITHSGKSVYKLSDFGTSSQASDTDQKCPLVGTEEYLHPVLYKNAFFNSSEEDTLRPTCGELWSLACTFFHAITGNVPFRPLGGSRSNRKAMLSMITLKPMGAISGVQTMDGNFRWSKELPGDCQMSESLRAKVTPLLQGLMEMDVSKQWTFKTFLYESKLIQEMRSFHVFDTDCGHTFLLYLHPRQSLAELQDALAFHTELHASSQLLFHRVQPLLSMLSGTAQVKDLPHTDPHQPLLLVARTDKEGRCRRQSPAHPELLLEDATLEEDYTRSFHSSCQLHFLWDRASSLQRLPSVLFSAVLALRTALTSTLSTVETRFRVLSATCQERQTRLVMLTQIIEVMRLAESQDQLRNARRICDKIREDLWNLKYQLDEMRKSSEPLRFDNPLSEASFTESCEVLQHMAKTGSEIWLRFQDRRNNKVPLSEMEQAKHKGDREIFNRTCTESAAQIQSLLHKRDKLVKEFTAHKKKLCERLEAAQAIDSLLLKLKEESETFSQLLHEIWNSGSKDLKRLADIGYGGLKQSTRRIREQFENLITDDLPNLETFKMDTQDPR